MHAKLYKAVGGVGTPLSAAEARLRAVNKLPAHSPQGTGLPVPRIQVSSVIACRSTPHPPSLFSQQPWHHRQLLEFRMILMFVIDQEYPKDRLPTSCALCV